MYKIKRVSDGMYSTGGLHPNFTKRGKLWQQLGHLKNHFRCIKVALKEYEYLKYKDPYVPKSNFVVEEYEIERVESYSDDGKSWLCKPLHTFIKDKIDA